MLSDGSNDDDNSKSQTIKFQHPKLRKLLRALAASAVLVDATYSGFLYLTAPEGFKVAAHELGFKVPDTMTTYIQIAATPFIFANLINDLTPIDVMKEADDLALTLNANNSKKTQQKTNTLRAIFLLTVTLKLSTYLYNAPIGAIADAIPVGAFVDNYFSGITAKTLGYFSLILVGGLETLYGILFYGEKLENHVKAFIHTLAHFSNFLRDIVKNPLGFLEVVMQITTNAVNRGISFAFIMEDVLKQFFNLQSQTRLSQFLSKSAGYNAFGVTYFTRFLSVHKKFMNEDYKLITSQEYKKASVSKEFILDMVFSAIQGGAGTLLAYELLKPSPWNYVLAGGIGTLLYVQSAYSHYVMNKQRNALNHIHPEELKKRKKDETETTEKTLLIQDNDQIVRSNTLALPEDLVERNNNLFEQIKANQKSTAIEIGAAIVANSTQVIRLFALFLLVEIVNKELLNNSFSLMAIFAITLLAGGKVFKNDATMYQGALTNSWTSAKARWQIETRDDKNSSSSGFFRTAQKVGRVLTTSNYDYTEDCLDSVLNSKVLAQTF